MAKVLHPSRSYLEFLHSQFLNLSNSFRTSVCNECGWSEATFYRKARSGKGISKAERERIVDVFEQMIENLLSKVKNYTECEL